jgi:cytochrome c oxidase subunit 2
MSRWFPENVSSYGKDIDSLFSFVASITGIWFFLVLGALLLFLIRYRSREGRRAVPVRGDNLRQAAWTLLPLLVVVLLDIWIDLRNAPVWARVKQSMPPSPVRVQVTGKQFNWEIAYPGPDGQFGTVDDLVLDNELHVPVNTVVRVTLTSRDVIHSFFLPNLRLKQDCVPGRRIEAWFEATRPGRYEIPCAELCGFGHSGMKGWLTVHPPGEYEKWVEARWPSS